MLMLLFVMSLPLVLFPLSFSCCFALSSLLSLFFFFNPFCTFTSTFTCCRFTALCSCFSSSWLCSAPHCPSCVLLCFLPLPFYSFSIFILTVLLLPFSLIDFFLLCSLSFPCSFVLSSS